MKKVIVDRGIYKLGIKYANGKEIEPSWESTEEGNSLIIGHEDEQFQISVINDVEFILRELSERLKLNLNIEKFTCDHCDMEFYANTKKFEVPEICTNCGSDDLTREDFIEFGEVE